MSVVWISVLLVGVLVIELIMFLFVVSFCLWLLFSYVVIQVVCVGDNVGRGMMGVGDMVGMMVGGMVGWMIGIGMVVEIGVCFIGVICVVVGVVMVNRIKVIYFMLW